MANQVAVRQKMDLKPMRRSRDEVAINMNRSGKSEDFVYVNRGFASSVNNVNNVNNVNSLNERPSEYAEPPPTSVIREQYCVCAKWPKAQKLLAVAVGLLLGALIGLSVTYALRINPEDTVIGSIFRQPTAADTSPI